VGANRIHSEGSVTIFGVLLFGVVGLGLIALGWWGVRRGDQLSTVPSWDKKSAERRRRTVRRGSFTCLGIGVIFILAAVLSAIAPHPR